MDLSMPFFFFKFFFNWRKIALQCCVDFCSTTKQIGHNYTFITSLLSLPPLPHPTPPGHHRAPDRAPWATFSPAESLYMLMLLCPPVPLSPSPTVSTSKYVPRYQFSRFHIYMRHIYVLGYGTYLSLSD